jgi:hypothetical protein
VENILYSFFECNFLHRRFSPETAALRKLGLAPGRLAQDDIAAGKKKK